MNYDPRMIRLARAYAVLRGAMLVAFMAALVVVPEKVMPGSSGEPARSLALVFASRTIVLGVALMALAIRGEGNALAWVLFADAAFQVFDTGLALATGEGAVAILPAALGALDVGAGLALRRATRAG